jgi:hypothetical protein
MRLNVNVSETIDIVKKNSLCPEGANLNLGCETHVALASLKRVILSSTRSEWMDFFLAANKVGEKSKVIGETRRLK